MDMDKRRDKELANRRFEREELGELLRFFSSLGITVTFGIVGFFVAGLWLDRWLTAMGWQTRGLPRLGCLLFGLGLSVYWAYLRITAHLNKFEKKYHPPEKEDS